MFGLWCCDDDVVVDGVDFENYVLVVGVVVECDLLCFKIVEMVVYGECVGVDVEWVGVGVVCFCGVDELVGV